MDRAGWMRQLEWTIRARISARRLYCRFCGRTLFGLNSAERPERYCSLLCADRDFARTQIYGWWRI